MKVLLKQATICDPRSAFFQSPKDILIEDGIIRLIADSIDQDADRTIQQQGLMASPGWMDLFAHFCDPGLEHLETLQSGTAAAAAGGFTDVLLVPNTQPVLHSKTQIEYIRGSNPALSARVHAMGALSVETAGKDLAEMYDMRQSGALAFGDGWHPVQSAGLMLKALQYVKAFNGLIIQLPDDTSLGSHGLMNEGIVSTRLGLPGKPIMAEELMVARDIKLLRYTGSRLHFTGITSARSLEYIRRGKEAGLDLTCSVTPYHLFFTDEELVHYDTNLKVYPPLRSAADVEALRKALLDGTIDAIASHHAPQDFDNKILEFEYARPGMIGLETSFGVITSLFPDMPLQRLVELFALHPKKITGLSCPLLAEGEAAELSLFCAGEWTVREDGFRSRCRNSAFIGKTLLGKPLGTIIGEKIYLNN